MLRILRQRGYPGNNYMCGPNVITRILVRGKQEGESQKARYDNNSRDERESRDRDREIFEQVKQASGHKPGWPLEARKGQGMQSPPGPPEKIQPHRPTLDLHAKLGNRDLY